VRAGRDRRSGVLSSDWVAEEGRKEGRMKSLPPMWMDKKTRQ
jgi:hypothetical protein